MAAKTIGYGSAISVTTTTGELLIGQVRNISGPGTDATDVDTTTLDSSSNFRTFVPSLIDPGEVSFQVAYSTTITSHLRLAEYHKNLSAKTFKAYHGSTTGDSDSFSAYVKSMGREIPLDDLITLDFSLKVSGLPGYTT